jgi:hypothetical protein
VGRTDYLASTSMVAHYGAVTLSAAWWLVCRRRLLNARTIHTLEFLGLVGVCTLYAVMATGIPQAFRPEMTIVLAFGAGRHYKRHFRNALARRRNADNAQSVNYVASRPLCPRENKGHFHRSPLLRTDLRPGWLPPC